MSEKGLTTINKVATRPHPYGIKNIEPSSGYELMRYVWVYIIAPSSNGRTSDFDSDGVGSNPAGAAI